MLRIDCYGLIVTDWLLRIEDNIQKDREILLKIIFRKEILSEKLSKKIFSISFYNKFSTLISFYNKFSNKISMENLGSVKRSGIEIEEDGEIFCIENNDKNKVLFIDTKKKIFKTKDIITKCILLESSFNNDTIKIEAPSVITESYKFILPSDNGNDNEFLKSDGNGNLSWEIGGNLPGGNIG